jgi:hypothetical protein
LLVLYYVRAVAWLCGAATVAFKSVFGGRKQS